jgi:hypothetical protein
MAAAASESFDRRFAIAAVALSLTQVLREETSSKISVSE